VVTNFEASLLRLKAALGVQSDKDVAAALGMSPTALNDRKKRDAFPVDRVRALASSLNFDAEYVIGGVAQAALEMIEAAREGKPLKKVSAEDAALLAAWHRCSAPDQRLLLGLLKRLTGEAQALATDGRYPQRVDAPPATLHDKPRKKGV
jgi:hypothetical protein